MPIDLTHYPIDDFYDEMLQRPNRARSFTRKLVGALRKMDDGELAARQAAAELAIKEMGITFTVYSEEEGTIDRAWPFDIIPRIIARSEWERIEAGLKQRVRALNLFINDLYHDQKIVKDGVFPRELLARSVNRTSCASPAATRPRRRSAMSRSQAACSST